MARLIDYLAWRGDLRFDERPLCDADSLVFSALAYLKFPDICLDGAPRTLRDCCDILLHGVGIRMMTADTDDSMQDVVRLAAASARFGRLLVRDYVDILEENPADPVQFSAVTFELDETTRFIAFRGTDSSIAGWKEDFMISFTRTRAQELALDYLQRHLEPGIAYYVGGHSKGANLTLYAACLLDEARQARIRHLYINDGPGLCPEVLSPELLERLDARTTVLVPEFCVIGRVFAPPITDTRIVKSTARTLAQHSIFSWAFEGGQIAYAETHDPRSLRINEILNRWMTALPADQRSRFTDEVFTALTRNGAVSLPELVEKGPSAFEDVLISLMDADHVAKNALIKLQAAAVETNLAQNAAPESKTKQSFFRRYLTEITMGAAGLSLVLLPPPLLRMTLTLLLLVVTVLEGSVTVQRLAKNKWDLRREQTRVILCIMLAVLFALSFLREQALLMLISAAAGALALIWAYLSAAHLQKSRGQRLRFWMYLAEGVLSFVFGIALLLVEERPAGYYTDALGLALLADCLLHVLVRRQENRIKRPRPED